MAIVSSLVFFTATFVWVYIFLTSLWLKRQLRLVLDRLFPTPHLVETAVQDKRQTSIH